MHTQHQTPAVSDAPTDEEWVMFKVGVTPLEVSNLGRVRKGDESKRVLSYTYVDNDIPKVRFKYRTVDGGFRFLAIRSVPKLVAQFFLPPSTLPLLKHRDGNKQNCRADNLYWDDYAKRPNTPLMEKGLTKRALVASQETGPTLEEMYASGTYTYDYAMQKHKEAGIAHPFTMERRPDMPNQENIPHYHRRSVPLAEWEAMKTYNSAPTPTHLYPDTTNNPPRYTLSTVPQLDAHGNALPTPFPIFPEKLPEEDARDIEDSGLYFSQARVADRAYTALFHNPARTPLEDAALKNLKKLLDYE